MWHSRLFDYHHTDDIKDRPRDQRAGAGSRLAIGAAVILPLLCAVLLLLAIHNAPGRDWTKGADPPTAEPAEPAAAELTGLTVSQLTARSCTLSWDRLGGSFSYEIFWSGDGGLAGGGDTVKGTSYAVAGLRPGSSYTFTVTPLREEGRGVPARLSCVTPEVAEVLGVRAEALDDSRLKVTWDYLDTGQEIDWDIYYGHERDIGETARCSTKAGQGHAAIVLENLYPHTSYTVRIGDEYGQATTRQAPLFNKWGMGLAYFSFFDRPQDGSWETADQYQEARSSFPAGSAIVAKYGVYCGYTATDKNFELLVMARLEDGYSYVKSEGPLVINNDLTWWTGGFYAGELGSFQQAGTYLYDIYIDRRYFGSATLTIY